MGKYVDILDKGFRAGASLYAESIPHLLHWDLAYFWILERDAHRRPAEWGEQINAWRYLVALLLTDQLDIESEPIREPFLSLTKSYGIDEVRWLKLKHAGDCVGALSPTVLARPLPDYNRGDLRRWEQKLPHPDQSKPPDVLAHFVKLAIQHLDQLQQEGQSKSPIPPKLARILEREFKGAREMIDPPEGHYQSIPILKQVSWIQEEYESCIEPIELLVGGQNYPQNGQVYIPRCEQCGAPLTRSQSTAPVEIQDEGEPFILECGRPTCRGSNELSLRQFLIWVRDREVIVWDRQGVFPVPAKGFPPLPAIVGREIQFEWQPAQLPGAERTNRFLRFRFTDSKQLTPRKLSEIFYHKLLAPGALSEFNGLPFQLEWREAIENFAEVSAEPDSVGVKVAYNRIKVRGLPEPINWVYGSLSLKQAPDLAVGLYPNPQVVPEKWKWYRLFLHGQERRQYRLQAPEAKEILPWLAESTSGFPKFFSVHSSDNAGVSYYKQPEGATLSSESPARLNIGVDFGTTNTVIYFLPSDKDFSDLKRRPKEFCVEPARFAQAINWFARAGGDKASPAGDFLPGENYGQEGPSRYLAPSVLWELNGKFLIRWGADEPLPQALPRSYFKLDRGDTDQSPRRRAFLQEMLLLALPSILQRLHEAGSLTTWNLNIALGFAFPLAFGSQARQRMQNVITDISAELKNLTGFGYSNNVISESEACAAMVGSSTSNPSDSFLVADMGGGTMDLALFTDNGRNLVQIGSVQFAGETFLNTFAAKRGIDQLALDDDIRRESSAGKYSQDAIAQQLLQRFTGIAFEFLRTMIAAYRRANSDQMIHLVLAGNGWYLASAFSNRAATYTPKQIFAEYYEDHLVKNLGDDKLRLHNPMSELPSSKHLVAVGSLEHAMAGRSSQLDQDKPARSKLPAGRRMVLTHPRETPAAVARQERIEWFDLVGGQLPFAAPSGEALHKMEIHFDFEQIPPLSDPWRTYLLHIFGVRDESQIPHPETLGLLGPLKSKENMPAGNPAILEKGPLQLIVENHWTDWLGK